MVQSEVFDRTCTSGSCHSAQTRAGGLSLITGESYDQLVNVTPQNSAARANGLNRVTPSQEAESFLLRKLAGDLNAGEGSSMPLAGSPLKLSDPELFEMIRQWVLAGAPRDPE